MGDRDRYRNVLHYLFTNDLKKKLYEHKDATDDDFEKKMIDSCALYHDQSYPIRIEGHVMVANVSHDGTDMKITFTLIHNFASLFTVAAVKPKDQPSHEKLFYFNPSTCNDTSTCTKFVCPRLFKEENDYMVSNGYVKIRVQVQLFMSVIL